MKALVTIQYNDNSVEEREHEGKNIDEVMKDFLDWNMGQPFEVDDVITFKIIEK